MAPLLTVVVPAYGSGDYLSRSLSSLLEARTRVEEGEVEIIVGIDPKEGSRDEEIARKILEGVPEASVAVHPARLGPLLSRLDGAKRAKGAYVCFLDSDDRVETGYFARILPVLKEKKPDVLGFSFNIIVNGKKRAYPFFSRFEGDGQRMLRSLFLDIGTRGFMWTKCWKRSLLLSYDGPLFGFLEDTCLGAILFTKARKSVSLPDRLVDYEEGNPSSLTSRKDPRRYKRHVEALASIRAYYDLHGLARERKLFSSYRWRHALSLLYARKRARKDGMGEDEEKEAARLFRAAMDLRRPLFESVPSFKETYESFPFFSSKEE